MQVKNCDIIIYLVQIKSKYGSRTKWKVGIILEVDLIKGSDGQSRGAKVNFPTGEMVWFLVRWNLLR